MDKKDFFQFIDRTFAIHSGSSWEGFMEYRLFYSRLSFVEALPLLLQSFPDDSSNLTVDLLKAD